MNAKQWRQAHPGQKVIFRSVHVYLFQPGTGIVVHAPVNSGAWMAQDDVDQDPWVREPTALLSPALRADLMRTAESCYCDQGVGTCDFCSGVRPAPRSSVQDAFEGLDEALGPLRRSQGGPTCHDD